MKNFGRILSLAGQNFVRNAWLSLITLTLIVITLFAVNVMVSINYVKSTVLSSLEDWVDITINLKKSVSATDVAGIVSDLDALEQVALVKVRTPDENLESFRIKNPEIADSVLPSLDDNPLTYSIVVKAYSVDQYATILEYLKTAPFNELVEGRNLNDLRDFTERANIFIDRFNTFATAFTLFFILIGAIVVFNTIRVSIFTHREEVGIMKLVGATNWFVRAPFLVESVMYSLTAVIITFIIVYPLLQLTAPTLTTFFSGIDVNLLGYYQANFWFIFGGQFLGIAILNLISTSMALRKYLRV